MPELPEVETTLSGIKPHILGQKILNAIVRHHNLRWPIPQHIKITIKNQVVNTVSRRGKYLILQLDTGALILHLGMSGSLRILTHSTPAQKHDHVDLEFANNKVLRFTDPRRFGALLWTTDDPLEHVLLKNLGPEPFDKTFTENYLEEKARNKKLSIKAFIMDSKIVVGVGNIYAAEALFIAGINPTTRAQDISLEDYKKLATAIKKILRAAIKAGGTTLKDFLQSDGKPGYFKFRLQVYGRGNMPCVKCKTTLQEIRLGQRSTVFCPNCQQN